MGPIINKLQLRVGVLDFSAHCLIEIRFHSIPRSSHFPKVWRESELPQRYA